MGRMDELRDKAQKVNERLDEFAAKASGPDVAYGATPGYTAEDTEADAREAADSEGVTLYRNADGTHEAVDESNLPDPDEAEPDS